MTEDQIPVPLTRIPFAKMSGSGNDFIVIDNHAGMLQEEHVATFTRRVCRRRLSVGADGVVLIETARADQNAHFRWRYLNADGSDGDLCGNGAMCGARFAVLHGLAPAACRFQTASGLVEAVVDPFSSLVRIKIGDTGNVRLNVALNVADHQFCLHAVHAGVPHAILVVEDADAVEDFIAIGRSVRHHADFAPAGTNFDVIAIRHGQTLRMRTYERGVEDETLACGTGAVASAVIAAALGLVRPPVTVITSSGLPLMVDFAWNGAAATNVTLAGRARFIAEGEIWSDALE